MEKKRDVSEVGDLELMTEFFKLFGARRVVQLLGWSTWWGIRGVNDFKGLRAELEGRGLSESSAYRALADFKKLKEHLENKEGRTLSVAEVVSRLRAL